MFLIRCVVAQINSKRPNNIFTRIVFHRFSLCGQAALRALKRLWKLLTNSYIIQTSCRADWRQNASSKLTWRMTSLKDSLERWASSLSLPSWSLLSINEKRAALTRGRLPPPGSGSGREEMEKDEPLRYFLSRSLCAPPPFPLRKSIDFDRISAFTIAIYVLVDWSW